MSSGCRLELAVDGVLDRRRGLDATSTGPGASRRVSSRVASGVSSSKPPARSRAPRPRPARSGSTAGFGLGRRLEQARRGLGRRRISVTASTSASAPGASAGLGFGAAGSDGIGLDGLGRRARFGRDLRRLGGRLRPPARPAPRRASARAGGRASTRSTMRDAAGSRVRRTSAPASASDPVAAAGPDPAPRRPTRRPRGPPAGALRWLRGFGGLALDVLERLDLAGVDRASRWIAPPRFAARRSAFAALPGRLRRLGVGLLRRLGRGLLGSPGPLRGLLLGSLPGPWPPASRPSPRASPSSPRVSPPCGPPWTPAVASSDGVAAAAPPGSSTMAAPRCRLSHRASRAPSSLPQPGRARSSRGVRHAAGDGAIGGC